MWDDDARIIGFFAVGPEGLDDWGSGVTSRRGSPLTYLTGDDDHAETHTTVAA